jgi:DNA-binding response OmpR family regulator
MEAQAAMPVDPGAGEVESFRFEQAPLSFVVEDHGSRVPGSLSRGARGASRIGRKMRGDKSNVARPFVYDELVARMRAVLRRTNGPRHPRLSVRELEIDLASRVVRLAGEAVQLSAKEYELLVALAEDPERVFKKEELLRNVWGFRSLGRTRTLDSHASRLRRKLNRNGAAAYVINVWGVGYRLVASAG